MEVEEQAQFKEKLKEEGMKSRWNYWDFVPWYHYSDDSIHIEESKNKRIVVVLKEGCDKAGAQRAVQFLKDIGVFQNP